MLALLSAIPFVGTVLSFFTGGTGLLAGLSSLLTVVTKGAIDLLGWYLAEFYKGLGVILSNLSTMLVIITIVLGSSYYVDKRADKAGDIKCEETIKDMRKHYKFVPIKKGVKVDAFRGN